MRGARVAMVGLLAAALSPSVSRFASAQGTAGRSADTRTFLSLDGNPAGVVTDVVQTQTAAGYDEKLTFRPGAMPPSFYTTWISPTLQGQRPLRALRLATFGVTGQAVSVVDAAGVAPRQIDFPALDAAARVPLVFTVTFSAPTVQTGPATGAPPVLSPTLALLNASSFRLAIDGTDATHVSKIDALSVTSQPTQPIQTANVRRPPVDPAAVGVRGSPVLAGKASFATATVGISNLVIYVAQSYAQTFQQWLATAATATKNGSIAYMKADLTTWGTLSLSGLTISQITTETGSATPRARIEMKVGGVQFSSTQ